MFKGQGGEHYVIGFSEVNGKHKKGDPNVQINQEHNKVRQECFEPISENGEMLLDLNI